jgi:hypothetical protein
MVMANKRNRLTLSVADFAEPLMRFVSADYSFASVADAGSKKPRSLWQAGALSTPLRVQIALTLRAGSTTRAAANAGESGDQGPPLDAILPAGRLHKRNECQSSRH